METKTITKYQVPKKFIKYFGIAQMMAALIMLLILAILSIHAYFKNALTIPISMPAFVLLIMGAFLMIYVLLMPGWQNYKESKQ
jgi:peptidoglycan/LPS O-acetylase OafA/YrhL